MTTDNITKIAETSFVVAICDGNRTLPLPFTRSLFIPLYTHLFSPYSNIIILSVLFFLVAIRLVHPLSPRGKLVHWGREGIKETNYLVKQACAAVPDDKDKIVLRDEIFRLATSPNQAKQLQETAKNKNCEEFCEWMDRSQLLKRAFIDCDAAENVHGGLRLYNGCKVLHLPSYLKGLWAACEVLSSRSTDLCLQWEYLDLFEQDDTLKACKDLDHHYDTIIWAAGSGLFESEIVSDWLLQPRLPDSSRLPFQLVRGQSVEIRFPESSQMEQQQALLSGKYISPLPDPGVVLVGATHEFAPEPLSHSEVKKEMREKTQSFCPHVWGKGSIVERYTEGIRVQSQRGSKGRLPIVGKLTREDEDTNLVREHWIFTGLSSRGLLYHGVYGKLLAQAISEGSEKCIETQCHDFDWWKRSKPEVNDHVVPGS